MITVEFDIKIKAGFEAKEINESLKEAVIRDLKVGLKEHLDTDYGLDTKEIEIGLSITKIEKSDQN